MSAKCHRIQDARIYGRCNLCGRGAAWFVHPSSQLGAPETLSWDFRTPPESIMLTWRNTTDQARIVGLNAHLYLKVGGGVVVSVKANCIDSTAAPEAVFAREVQKMKEERIKPFEQLTLEPFERGE